MDKGTLSLAVCAAGFAVMAASAALYMANAIGTSVPFIAGMAVFAAGYVLPRLPQKNQSGRRVSWRR